MRLRQRLTAALLASAVCISLAPASAWAGERTGQPTPAAGTKGEKRLAWQMNAVPWNKVFQWLGEQTGLPFVSGAAAPTGTFTFLPPAGVKQRLYTIPEIVDTLNAALSPQYLLIRRDDALVLTPADAKLDPALCPLVSLTDLPQRGKTEMVHVVLPLKAADPKDVLPAVRALLGPLGEVTVAGNRLLLRDAAGNLRLVVQAVADLDHAGPEIATLAHRCKHITATQARERLEQLFASARPGAPKGTRTLTITADPSTNLLLLRGSADEIAQAKDVLARIDLPAPGAPPVLAGPASLQIHAVPSGTAESLAATLQEVFRSSPGTKIIALGDDRVLIWASPEEQINIARNLQELRPTLTTETIALGTLEAVRTADLLRSMFGGGRKSALFIEADTARNTLILRGSKEQIDEVKTTLRALGETAAPQGKNVRVLTVRDGSAADLAAYLAETLRKLRDNPVKVIVPGSDKPGKPPIPPAKGKADPSKEPGKTSAKTPPPVTITAVGNKLIITSDDPQMLQLVEELVRIPSSSQGNDDFQVIRLRHADAVAVAKLLDETFNGPAREVPGKGIVRRVERIRVVADPSINALVSRANPLELLTIKRLLEKTLDVEDTAADESSKTWILTLKHLRAADAAKLLQGVYRDVIATPKLAVGIEERTNTLVLRCSAVLHEDIRRLMAMLDTLAAEQKK